MARCEPIIDAIFVQKVTGADISDLSRVDELISITSDLVAEEILGTTRCFSPDLAPMQLKVIVAEFVAYNLTTKPNDQIVRAETVGDYRVEYQSSNSAGMDLDRLKRMLKPLRVRNYTTRTVDTLTNEEDVILPLLRKAIV
jgi:hypothetical protein